MPPRLPAIIVFDLDGTLVDSRGDLAASANQLIGERGGTPLPARAIGAMIGDGVRSLVERALAAGCGRDADDEDVSRFRAIYADRLLETTRPYAGVHDLLARLARRVPLALLTNKPLAPTGAILRGLDLERHFRAVVADGSGFPLKPDPAALLDLVRRAGAEPADCLYVGDSAVDLHTARAADSAVALARYGYGYGSVARTDLAGDEVLLDRPLDLLEYLGVPDQS